MICTINFVQSPKGETSAIIVGTLESLLHHHLDGKYRVVTHKINQSGASSKEIGDIDVFDHEGFYYSIEVKDKNFTEHDVEHAFNKVLNRNGRKAAFIYGLQVNFNENEISKKLKKFEEKGLFVMLQDINSHIKNILFRLPVFTRQEFIERLIETSKAVNCKQETTQWIKQLFSDLRWKASEND